MRPRIAREYYATYYPCATSGSALASEVFLNFFCRRTDIRGGVWRAPRVAPGRTARSPPTEPSAPASRLLPSGLPLRRATPRNTPLCSYICRRRACGPTKMEISCGQASLKSDVVHATYYAAKRLESPPSPDVFRHMFPSLPTRSRRSRSDFRCAAKSYKHCLTSAKAHVDASGCQSRLNDHVVAVDCLNLGPKHFPNRILRLR